ncbi:MAG: hypothetical protein ACRD2X_11195 [Vicinamibacteraceae bacterium]
MSPVYVDVRDHALANIWSRLSDQQQQAFLRFADWFADYHRPVARRRSAAYRNKLARYEAQLPVGSLLRSRLSCDWADVTATCKAPRDDFKAVLAELREEVRRSVSTLSGYRAVDKRIAHVTTAAERYTKCYAVAAFRVGRYAVRAVSEGAYRHDHASIERALEILWPHLAAYPDLAARVLTLIGFFDSPQGRRSRGHGQAAMLSSNQPVAPGGRVRRGALIQFPSENLVAEGAQSRCDPARNGDEHGDAS